MNAPTLEGRQILVLEDDYLLADDLARALRKAGAVVVGPIASAKGALALIALEPALDGAILDVSLGSETAYPVADALAARSLPYVFATGYGAADLLPGYEHIPRFEKPVNIVTLIYVLSDHTARLRNDGK